MKQRTAERIVKTAIAVCMAILLLSSLASAETNRQKVVKEACYALDQGTGYVCGETVKTGNWDYVF